MLGVYRTLRVLVVVSLLLAKIGADLIPERGRERLAQVATQVGESPENSQEIIQAFESRLLTLFGLRSRPRPNKKMVIPKYMLELYKQQAQNPDDIGINFKVPDRSIQSANTARSFFHQGRDNHANEEEQRINKRRFWFNMSSVPDNEQIKAAELRLYRLKFSEDLSDKKMPKPIWRQVSISEILQPSVKNSDVISRLIDTRAVDIRDSNWDSFDVLPAVLRWKQTPHLNHGLEVHITFINGSEANFDHVRLKRTANLDETTWTAQQPLLITYSDDGRARSTDFSRSKRSSDRKHRKKGNRDNCRRHDLYVDFSDVGWNDWIVAPPGYQAYFCHGECPFPLADHLNSTNHAIVQTLVNSVKPKDVPRACCVPTELSPISMLYLDEYDKVVLKNYQDMVVEGCGCR